MRKTTLTRFTDHQLREGLVTALNTLYAPKGKTFFNLNEILPALTGSLGLDKESATPWAKSWNTLLELPSGPKVEDADVRKLHGCIWDLIARGVIYPRFGVGESREYGREFTSMAHFGLTGRGEQLLKAGASHPQHPNFISAFRSEAKGVSDTVASALEDAAACFTYGLNRPALVAIGVACEHTLAAAHAALRAQNIIGANITTPTSAKTLLGQVRDGLNAADRKQLAPETKHRAISAVSFLEVVRQARNTAAHGGSSVIDDTTAESHIRCAAHHLKELWSNLIAPASQLLSYQLDE